MPLRVDLLRHAEAAPSPGDDHSRALTPRGRQDVLRLAEAFLARGWGFHRVYTSPLRRAQETASLLIERASPQATCVVLEALTPEREPEDVVEALEAEAAEGHVVLVGHQPVLGRLAGFLLGGAPIPLPTASLVALQCGGGWKRGSAILEAQLHASQLT